MSTPLKNVGNYIIYIREITIDKEEDISLYWLFYFIIGVGIAIITFQLKSNITLFLTTAIAASCFMLHSLKLLLDNLDGDSAYYIDTTMHDVGGKIIRKTTLEQDNIIIDRAIQKFEREILYKINKEKELEEIVGKCK